MSRDVGPAQRLERRWSRAWSWQSALCVAVLAAFTALYAINAWVVDDAYITFRTIDNVLRGHGLTWNVGERVQVYTHPLWMLALVPFAALSGEVFYTSLVVSFGCLLATFAWMARGWRGRDAALRTAALVAMVAASKPIMDFASSGLEQPLGYLWLALFFVRLRAVASAPAAKDLGALVLIASLACVTRQDTLLLYLPALLFVALRVAAPRKKALFAAAAGMLPIVAWHAFSLLYYGSLVPNTAHAKLLGPSLGIVVQTGWGLRYVLLSLAHDPASILLLAGVVLARKRYDRVALALLGGAGLYVAYTIGFAAVSTHMLGRFLALPFFLAAVVLCDALPDARRIAIAIAMAAGALIACPTSAAYAGSRVYDRVAEWQKNALDPVLGGQRWVDTKWMTVREHAGAMTQIPGLPVPRHGWYLDGLDFRDAPERLQVGGALAGSPVGYFGYAAGPTKIVVDLLALTDPLRARLPACGMVRPGHFMRPVPEGYVESLLAGENRLLDPHLRAFYEMQLRVLRDPLWSPARLRAIVDLNLGRGKPMLEAYVRANAGAFADETCKAAVMAARGRYGRPQGR